MEDPKAAPLVATGADYLAEEYLSDELRFWDQQAKIAASKSRSDNTKRAYSSDWADFVAWCDRHQRHYLPAQPKTIELYITQLANRPDNPVKATTVRRRMAAISVYHQVAGFAPPTNDAIVKSVWKGIRRSKGVAPSPKRAIMVEDLRRLVESLDLSSLSGLRDRAILLLGFASAMRRSELVSINLEDLDFSGRGVIVTIRRSKTNQEGEAEYVAILYGNEPRTCPVRALEAWLAAAAIRRGPVFREIDRHGNLGASALTARVVAMVVKRAVTSLGQDADKFAGHSLRRGFVTSSARAGATDREIMKQTRHKSRAMIDRYMEEATIWDNHPQTKLRL